MPWARIRASARRARWAASSSSEPWASRRSLSASARSMSLARSHSSARIPTRLSATERNPPCTTATTGSPLSCRMSTAPSASVPSNGAWCGRMPTSPSAVRARTIVPSPVHTVRSAATSSTWSRSPDPSPSAILLQLLGLLLHVLEATAHEERLLRDVVVLALGQLLERVDGLVERDERPVQTGEGLGDEGVLREEPLDATGPLDEDLVLLRELVDAEDRDDVLEVLVALQ